MHSHRRLVAVAAVGAAVSLLVMGLGVTSSVAAGDQSVALSGSHADYASPANLKDHVEASRPIDLLVLLKLRNADEAQAVVDAVSNPSSASYRHYLSTAQWNQRFAPAASSVAAVKSWLRSQGLSAGSVPSNNLYVSASGTAAQIERAFRTTLNDYAVQGKAVRAAATDISVGASVASVVDGVVGIDDTSAFLRPAIAIDSAPVGAATAHPVPGAQYPPTPGFRNAPPCTKFYGQMKDTTDPAYGGGFPTNPPYTPCGYTPTQLRQAYGMAAALGQGIDGTGQTVGIVDAYDSPTIAADAQTYSAAYDRQHPFILSNFTNLKASSYRFGGPTQCGASSWFSEQTLDVEAVHGMAPGAKIVFSAGASCLDPDLIPALNNLVAGHLAQIVSNSYGYPGEAVTPTADFPAYGSIAKQAAATGIGLYFSSGDWADNFFLTGVVSATFPASLPGVTAVGGTSLAAMASSGGGTAYGFETGWETGKSYLCTKLLIQAGLPVCQGVKVNTWQPPAPGFLVYGSGGGTSTHYKQPPWQVGVVPDSVSKMNGPTPMRAIPDVAAVGDPSTGMLIGQTQAFPNGVYWDVYRIGGTSLSSPLTAGMMALADQFAGAPHGFANPALYAMHGSSAYHDIVPNSKMNLVRVDYLDGVDNTNGTFRTARVLGYQGPETSPSGTTQTLSLHAAAGWDNETGNGSPTGMAFLKGLA